MLDSDIGNQILPYVRFYEKEVLNGFKSEQENRPIYDMVDFVRIEIPGNAYSIIDTIAGEHHKKQYPQQWARYQNERTDDKIEGTLLRDWSILRASQVKELNHFKFYTIEQVAEASDAQLNTVSGIIGMGGHVFREKARQYLKVAKDSAVVQHQEEELRKRDNEISELREQMQALMQSLNDKPKRGRPNKEDLQESPAESD